MSTAGWGGTLVGWSQAGAVEQRISDLETNQEQQAIEIAALEAEAIIAYRASLVGAGVGAAIGAGATVRFALPNIVERFPNDSRWNRVASGVLEYDGTIGGIYEVHCPVAFGTSAAVLASYTATIVEGTGLDTGSPVVRDTATFTIERQLVGINVTAAITGLVTLQPTGGQIALRFSHNQGASITVTPATIALLLLRVSQRDD